MASPAGGASQRLLTMKFMQRAAAASPTSSSTPATPSDDGHSSKRRKISGTSSIGAPVPASYVVDQKAAQAALEHQDRMRQAAMDRMAERLGDSHWVLDPTKLPSSHKQAGTPLKIVQVGFSEIDRPGDSEEGQDEEEARVFRSYGPTNNAQKEKNGKDSSSDSDSDSDGDGNSSDSDSDSAKSDSGSSSEEVHQVPQSKPGRASYGIQKRAEIRSRKVLAQEKSRKMAAERRKKDVSLGRLSSISGAASFGNKGARPGQRR